MKKFLVLPVFILLTIGIALCLKPSLAHASSNSNLIDDGVFDNANTLSAAQIDSWLNNNFPSSCISTNNGFSAPDSTGYTPAGTSFPDGYYQYGSPVSAGTVIYHISQTYQINPQVLLTKLQNEEQLVDGSAGCSTWRYASAVGYACTDSGTNTHNYTYTGASPYTDSGVLVTPLYYQNGVAQNSISGSCVNKNVMAGFSEQLVHAAWLLTFSRHKSEGQTSYAVITSSANHCEDNDTCPASMNIPAGWACYSGLMTQGTFKRCPTDSTAVFYDGYATIDGASTHMDTGATAALYVYTPHFQSFTSIFTNYFGAPYDVYSWSIVSQYAYTDSLKTTGADLTNLYPGQRVYVGFQAKNTGDTTWTSSGSNPIHVGTSSPQDRISAFCDPTTWLGCNRPAALKEASVAPGQTGTFEFWYKAPNNGTYREYFNLVSEGLKWFNDPGLSIYSVVKTTYSWSLVDQYAYTDANKTTAAPTVGMVIGHKILIGFHAKNTGNITWTNSGANPVRVGASNPQDRNSVFCDSTWLGCNRPAALKEASVAPGQTGTFEFMYNPTQTGTFREYFTPLVEGVTWMNNTGLNFYTTVNFDTSGTSNNVGTNQALTTGQSITSTDGRYKVVMQGDGNLVLYSINRALWASGTSGKPVAKAVMQGDGNLVLYDSQNKPYWASGTAGKGSSSLIIQTDGNLVIYDVGGHATWTSHTNGQL
jgi:hypothetical protein